MNIFVYQNAEDQEKDRRKYNLVLWANGDKTGKLELEDGNILKISDSIILSVYEGIVWE